MLLGGILLIVMLMSLVPAKCIAEDMKQESQTDMIVTAEVVDSAKEEAPEEKENAVITGDQSDGKKWLVYAAISLPVIIFVIYQKRSSDFH